MDDWNDYNIIALLVLYIDKLKKDPQAKNSNLPKHPFSVVCVEVSRNPEIFPLHPHSNLPWCKCYVAYVHVFNFFMSIFL